MVNLISRIKKLPVFRKVGGTRDYYSGRIELLVAQGDEIISKLNKVDNNSNLAISHIYKSLIDITEILYQYHSQNQKFYNLQQENLSQAVQQLQQSQRENLGQAIQLLLKTVRVRIIDDQKSEPEHGLAAHLYTYLPYRCALDIGANIGNFSEALLNSGYQVYAFEPFEPTYLQLQQRFKHNPLFHAFPYALGSVEENRTLNIIRGKSIDQHYGRADQYHSLINHSMPDSMAFDDIVTVPVKTLAHLHQQQIIPNEVGLVKVDTEGFDLEVAKGMGEFRYPVVICEFWHEDIIFGRSGLTYSLLDLVQFMRDRGYYWHLVLYRLWGADDGVSYYANYPNAIAGSWGNVFFFQDQAIFSQALNWCGAVLPTTYLY